MSVQSPATLQQLQIIGCLVNVSVLSISAFETKKLTGLGLPAKISYYRSAGIFIACIAISVNVVFNASFYGKPR